VVLVNPECMTAEIWHCFKSGCHSKSNRHVHLFGNPGSRGSRYCGLSDSVWEHRVDGVDKTGLARPHWSGQEQPVLGEIFSVWWCHCNNLLAQFAHELQCVSYHFKRTNKTFYKYFFNASTMVIHTCSYVLKH